jgi:hypothetical protein
MRLGEDRMGSGWSPQDIVALLRRHVAAVAVLFVLTAGLAYHFEHSASGYVDTGTVAFTAPKAAGLFTYGQSLLVIDELTANSVMSAAGQRQVRNEGGTTSYKASLVNLNDEDFPNYSDPYVTVTTTSFDPAAAERTFTAVLKVLQQDLVALQARQGAKPATQIEMRVIAAPAGPVEQTGSRKRTLAALAILAVIVTFMVTSYLDLHPIRPRDLLRRLGRRGARAKPGETAGGWQAVPASRGAGSYDGRS